MKTYFTQSRILIWLVIILLIINISAVITIFYSIKERNEFLNNRRYLPDKAQMHHHKEKSFRSFMDLDEKQREHFSSAKHKFFLEAKKITGQMHEKRVEFMNEMASANPDTLKITEIANEIGSLHAKLKYQTFKHYIDMKSVCDKKQEERLMHLFRSMLHEDTLIPGPVKHEKENKRSHHFRRGE